jgi:proliferating cell nuclear antigen
MSLNVADCRMVARTTQANVIKCLVDALKDILLEAVFEFDVDGVRVACMDNTQVALVHLKLEGARFDQYHCPEPVSVCVNMGHLHKTIKAVNAKNTVTLFVDNLDPASLGIRVENEERRSLTTTKLAMLHTKTAVHDIPAKEFDSAITLPTTDFQKIIRDMSNIAKTVEITSTSNSLSFRCKGDFCTQETVLKGFEDAPNGESDDHIVQGIFNLTFLTLFCKCTNLCDTLKLIVMNDFPIILQYDVSSLGVIKLCLSPVVTE